MGRMTVVRLQVASLAVLALAVEAASRLRIVDPLFVPPPSAVVTTMAAVFQQALPRLGDTLLKTLGGYAIAVGLGVALGLVIGSLQTLRQVTMPYVVALYSLPKILLIPWIVLILGVKAPAAIISGTLFAVFPVLVLVVGGVRDVDPVLVTIAASMGASRRQLYEKVIVPAALPAILAGMRIGLVFALVGVLLTEMFAGIRGMGFLMQQLALSFNAAQLAAATVLVSVFSIAAVLSLDYLNQRLGTWR
jgi:NitT/TauT family transport system permease protein